MRIKDPDEPQTIIMKLGRTPWDSARGLASLLAIAGVCVWLTYSSKATDSGAALAPAARVPATDRSKAVVPARADVSADSNGRAASGGPPAKKVSFAATHRQLRDTHGVLSFTARTIAYHTTEPNDSFEYSIDAVALDKDGFKAKGKAWHFKVQGQDVESLFARWKAGTLFNDAR